MILSSLLCSYSDIGMCQRLMTRRHYRFFKKLDLVHKEEDRKELLFKRISFLINHFIKNKLILILDDGCGKGEISRQLSYFGFTVGIDPATRRIPEWKNDPNTSFLSASGESLPLKDQSIDVVVSQQVVEHVENVDAYLKEAYRVLKKRGILIISFPNKIFPIEGHTKLPFITYLPQSAFQRIVNVFAKRDYRVNRFTYKSFLHKIRRLGFERVYDVTKNILRRFFSGLGARTTARHYSLFRFILPSWNWVCLK